MKKKLWSIYLAIPFGIAILTCCIVNFAIDQKFTWSNFVTGSCLLAYLLLYTLLFGGKHRILLTYAVLCVAIVPFLYLIEWTSNLFPGEPVYWVTAFGIPVSIAWLGVCGLVILLRKLVCANVWLLSGLAVLGFYCAETFTNTRIDKLIGPNDSWRLSDHYPVIYLGPAAVLIFVGIIVTAIRHTRKSES